MGEASNRAGACAVSAPGGKRKQDDILVRLCGGAGGAEIDAAAHLPRTPAALLRQDVFNRAPPCYCSATHLRHGVGMAISKDELISLTAIYRIDVTNSGDLATAPHKYFGLPILSAVDLLSLPALSSEAIVVGGGGVLHWPEKIAALSNFPGLKIFWGGGTNTHGQNTPSWPAELSRFSLVGIRDWNGPFPWVPCASCMSSLFDTVNPPTTDIVVYDHKDFKTGVTGFPTLTNKSSMEKAVSHLASGAMVITNSYHGAYWATLLGRAVVVSRPFSSKFHHFRHQPAIANEGNWRSARPRPYPHALMECRDANRAYYLKVRALLGF